MSYVIRLINWFRGIFGYAPLSRQEAEIHKAKLLDKAHPVLKLNPVKSARPRRSYMSAYRLRYLRKYGILPNMSYALGGFQHRSNTERNRAKRLRKRTDMYYRSLCAFKAAEERKLRQQHVNTCRLAVDLPYQMKQAMKQLLSKFEQLLAGRKLGTIPS